MQFCVVDGRFLLHGSFNYSKRGVLGNYDHISVHEGGKITEDLFHFFDVVVGSKTSVVFVIPIDMEILRSKHS